MESHWQGTFNLGVRGDAVQYLRNEGQISPRVGVTYKYNQSNVFHAFYGRMFTPPNLEAISFAKLNTIGTRAQPEDVTNNTVRAERAHYLRSAATALTRFATLELTGWYKLSNFLSMPVSSARLRSELLAFERGGNAESTAP
ncbi:MAG: hypothetical protein U0361_21510 [Nitrospiraceae bacterium]